MKLGQTYQGKFLKRYKRFFVDVEMIDGPDANKIITAHCPNTGSMKGLLIEGAKVVVTLSDNPDRKLKYTLELIAPENSWVGVNTSLTNKIVHEALLTDDIKELTGYQSIKPEHKISKETRLDFFLSGHPSLPDCYVEVKNVTLKDETKNAAIFPDAVTERGLKHLNELYELKKSGARAVMLYVIQREDIDHYSLENPIDKAYSERAKELKELGLEIYPYQCSLNSKEIKINKLVTIK